MKTLVKQILVLLFVISTQVSGPFVQAQSKSSASSECVVLLHGLGRSALSMKYIERSLNKEGYVVVNKSYPSRSASVEELAAPALDSALGECPEHANIFVVTHSMGGILLRQYLSEQAIPNLQRVVMLAPPNQGNELAAIFSAWSIGSWEVGQWFAGPALAELSNAASNSHSANLPHQLGAVKFELGVIAGSRSYNPVFSRWLPGRDDGKVTVVSTRVDGMSAHIVMQNSHTFMMWDAEVIEQTVSFLQTGRFIPQ